MYLTKEEERILNGEHGVALQKAMQLVVSIGDIFKADRLLEIKSSQISGISYKNIGEAGLSFIEDLEKLGGKIKSYATLNPAGMDFKDWVKMKIPEGFARKQLRIVRSLIRMGAASSCTCTPYLIGNLPLRGEHISWAESSAVSFANSIIGAKTNREGGPTSLASAMIGKTPNYGLHLEENRNPNIVVKVKADLKSSLDHSLLGYCLGEMIPNGVPLIQGIKSYTLENMKAICASAASSGNIALYYVDKKTPLPEKWSLKDKEDKFEITDADLKRVLDKFSYRSEVDIVTLGCPHASINEIRNVAMLLKGKKLRASKDLWICTSSLNKAISGKLGYLRIIKNAGGKVAADTCMVVAPLENMGYKGLATNSAKAAHYVPSTCNIPSVLVPLEESINLVLE